MLGNSRVGGAARCRMSESPPPGAGAASSPPSLRRFAIVLNEQSGAVAKLGREAIAETLAGVLAEGGATAVFHWVDGDGLLPKLDELVAGYGKPSEPSAFDALIVGGGDGTVASVAGRLAGTGVPMAVLPLGTFNLAARDFGMPLDLAGAARALLTARVRKVDALEVQGRLSLCFTVLGFYPALKLARPEHHGWWIVRALWNVADAFRRAATFPALDLVFLHEGEATRARTRMVLITNNEYEDVFGLLPRRTGLDDGYFTAYVSRHRSRRGMLRSVLAWLMGRWTQDARLLKLSATEMEIDSPGHRRRTLPIVIDGEIARVTLPLKIKTLPRHLDILVPVQEPEAEGEESTT